MKTARGYLTIAAMLAAVDAVGVAQVSSGSFAWYGELVSTDAGAGVLTVRANIRDNSLADVQRRQSGDRLMLIWEVQGAAGGDGPIVLAVATPEETKFLRHGYLTPVEFVASDTGTKTVTFKVKAPEAALQTAASIGHGRWIKVTAPMEQPGPDAVLTAVLPAEKPTVRSRLAPSLDVQAPAAAAALPPVKANGGISGRWEFRWYRENGGVSAYLDCELAQDGARIGGACKAPGDAVTPVSGTAAGAAIELQIPPGATVYSGTLDASGARMMGTFITVVSGVELPFQATKN